MIIDTYFLHFEPTSPPHNWMVNTPTHIHSQKVIKKNAFNLEMTVGKELNQI